MPIRALLLAGLLAACGGGAATAPDEPEPTETPKPWPEDYETWVCAALQELELNARPAIGDLVEAAEVFDIDGAAEAAERAADSATTARGMLDLAPRWGPGNQLAKRLEQSTTLFARGANLVHEGVSLGDLTAVEEGSVLIRRATNRMSDANIRAIRLRDRTGFGCR